MHFGSLAQGRLSAGDRPSLLRSGSLLFPVIADNAIIPALRPFVNGQWRAVKAFRMNTILWIVITC